MGLGGARGSAKGPADPSSTTADAKRKFLFGDLWMWLQLMWLQFEVVRSPVGIV
jgi:hypothetical protein